MVQASAFVRSLDRLNELHLLETRWREQDGDRKRLPYRSRSQRRERARQTSEKVSFWTGGGEGKTHAGGAFDDAGGDLDQTQPQCRKLGACQIAGSWDRVADCEHQPIGARVQDEPHLIGNWRPARCAIGGKLRFVQLDQVLGLTTRAIEAVIKPFRRAMREIGDNEADVETEFASPQCGRWRAALCPRIWLYVASRRNRAPHPCR